jgi:hypothetical protein
VRGRSITHNSTEIRSIILKFMWYLTEEKKRYTATELQHDIRKQKHHFPQPNGHWSSGSQTTLQVYNSPLLRKLWLLPIDCTERECSVFNTRGWWHHRFSANSKQIAQSITKYKAGHTTNDCPCISNNHWFTDLGSQQSISKQWETPHQRTMPHD